jgi:hypothetical protein
MFLIYSLVRKTRKWEGDVNDDVHMVMIKDLEEFLNQCHDIEDLIERERAIRRMFLDLCTLYGPVEIIGAFSNVLPILLANAPAPSAVDKTSGDEERRVRMIREETKIIKDKTKSAPKERG